VCLIGALDSGTLRDAEVVRSAVVAEIEYLEAAGVPAGPDGKRSVAVALREERGRERQFNSTVGPMPALGRLPFRRG